MGCGRSKRVGVIEAVETPRVSDHQYRQAKSPKSQDRTEDFSVSQSGVIGDKTNIITKKTLDLIPVKPPRRKKKESVPPPEAFAAIDKHALKSPKRVCSSVSSLAQYLIKPTRNDMDKVRAFYRWITENISYVTLEEFNSEQTPVAVLQRGCASCGGYSRLFEALCNEVEIPCKLVPGFSKNFHHDPEKPFTENTEANHGWNIVFIDGEWRPTDVTWGAGCNKPESNTREKRFDEYHFLTDPEDFILHHFPFADKNLSDSFHLQLLERPVSLDWFNRIISPETEGIKWGFESLSHNTKLITVNKECEITFKTNGVVLQNISCKFSEDNTNQEYTQYVLLRKHEEYFSAKITPPAEGKYNLILYGKPVGSTEEGDVPMIFFVVVCQAIKKEVYPYPDKSGVWGANPNANRYGFSDDIFALDVFSADTGEGVIRLETVQPVIVSLKLSHSNKVETDLNQFVFEYYDGNTLVIKLRLPYSGFYKLQLFAKEPEKETTILDHIADFLIDSKVSMKNSQGFPKTFAETQEFGCHLFEPLVGELPANTEVRLTLQSDKLMTLMINKKVHEKSQNNFFDVTFETFEAGTTVTMYGSPNKTGTCYGLYTFTVV